MSYAPAVGPRDAKLLLVGEALGQTEAMLGRPFVGHAGGMLDKVLRIAGIERSSLRIDNICRCQPPGNWLDGAPWEEAAVEKCSQYINQTLAEPHPVVVPMGAIPSRRLLGIPRGVGKMQDFHGTVSRDPSDSYWIVPTFHPSHLQRGASNLIGTVVHDLLRANDIALNGFTPPEEKLILDPPIDEFIRWAEEAKKEALKRGILWMAVDIETPEKEKGADEGELADDKDEKKRDLSYIITRVNLAWREDEGLTVPFNGPYIGVIQDLLADEKILKIFWNCPTPDQRILTADLHWMPVGQLKVGDAIVGFDEEVVEGRRIRRYKTAIVEVADRGVEEVYEVCFSDGSKVKTTGEHPWLMQPSSSIMRKFRWRTTKDLVPGVTLQRPFPVWETGNTWTHGYLAGMFDGEGCLSLQKPTGTFNVSVSQRIGPTFDTIKESIVEIGFECRGYTHNARKKDAHIGNIHVKGYTEDLAHFLGVVRPQRLLRKFRPELLGALQTRRGKDVDIVSITKLGKQEIVRLSTSSRTYILEGFGAHNSLYDCPRLEHNSCPVAEPSHDFLNYWHALQSDVPRGLGFVSPFYSMGEPWKHLSSKEYVKRVGERNSEKYAALDGIRTIRNAHGIKKDLDSLNMWDMVQRHMYELDLYALRPAEKVGLLLEKNELGKLKIRLEELRGKIRSEIAELVPQEVVPYEKELKTARNATDDNGNLLPGFKQITKATMGYVCTKCDSKNVSKAHTKTKKCAGATLRWDDMTVDLWVKEGTFNPASPPQVLAYFKHKGYKPGKAKKSKKDSTDKDTLEALEKKHGKKDPFFGLMLDDRSVGKILGTYVNGMLDRMDEEGRVHPRLTHKPSTLRLSCVNPNLQNLVSDDKKEDRLGLGKEFRKCIVAAPGCTLVELDLAGVEAVLTGYFAGDYDYIRLAQMSVHAYLTSHIIGEPADLSWDDDKLRTHLLEIKNNKKHKVAYQKCKRVIHGSSYGMSPYGMMQNYPDLFPTQKVAKEIQDRFFDVAPKVRKWQASVVQRADKQGYLGGDDHPFRYRHWYWAVINYRPIKKRIADSHIVQGKQVIEMDGKYFSVSWGDDAKRAVSFYPQSTAGGILKEACLRLFKPGSKWYIGDTFFGKTPFRMPIHDSIFLEVEDSKVDFVIEKAYDAMTQPIEQMPCPWDDNKPLRIGVDVHKGKVWSEMEKVEM